MKRALFWIISLVVFLGLGWIGAWFVFKLDFEASLDREEAAITAQGSAIGYDKREISGFPLQYRVRYEGLSLSQASSASVLHISAPEALAVASMLDTEHLKILFPPKLEIRRVPLFGGEALRAELISDNMAIELAREQKLIRFALAADELRVVRNANAGEAEGATLGVTLNGLQANGAADTEIGILEANVTSQSADIAVAGDLIGLPGLWNDVRISNARMDMKTNLTRSADFMSDLASGDGVVDMHVLLGEGHVDMFREGRRVGGLNADGTDFDLIINEGLYQIGMVGNAMELEISDLQLDPPGAVVISEMSGKFIAPVLNVSGETVFDISLEGQDITGSDSLWQAFDPQAVLVRDPAQAQFEGRFQYSDQLLDVMAGQSTSDQIGLALSYAAAELRNLSLTALNAQVDAAGALAQTEAGPDGVFDLRLTGVQNLLVELTQLGILPPESYDFMAQWIELLTDQANPDLDQWSSELEIKSEGIYVNGTLLQ